MIHIKATITFEEEDKESLSSVNDTLFTYNMMTQMCGASPIPSEICDIGEGKTELRFDFDYDGKNADKMLNLATKISNYSF